MTLIYLPCKKLFKLCHLKFLFLREPHIIDRFNYNSIWNSLMSTFLIFFNEEWHLFPIDYSHFKGKAYILYFILMVFFFQIILMKMFAALLINKFCGSASIKYLIKYNKDDEYLSFKFWKAKIEYCVTRYLPMKKYPKRKRNKETVFLFIYSTNHNNYKKVCLQTRKIRFEKKFRSPN